MVEKTIELIGVSANSIEEAVQLAITRAAVTLNGIHTAQIVNLAATVENNRVTSWRVTVRLTFIVKDQLHE